MRGEDDTKTCDRVSMDELCSELETIETELNWKNIEAHMENYEIKQVGILHLCRGRRVFYGKIKREK